MKLVVGGTGLSGGIGYSQTLNLQTMECTNWLILECGMGGVEVLAVEMWMGLHHLHQLHPLLQQNPLPTCVCVCVCMTISLVPDLS